MRLARSGALKRDCIVSRWNGRVGGDMDGSCRGGHNLSGIERYGQPGRSALRRQRNRFLEVSDGRYIECRRGAFVLVDRDGSGCDRNIEIGRGGIRNDHIEFGLVEQPGGIANLNRAVQILISPWYRRHLEHERRSAPARVFVVENPQVKSGRSVLITSGAAHGRVCITPTRAALEATEAYRQANQLGRAGGVTNGWTFWKPGTPQA